MDLALVKARWFGIGACVGVVVGSLVFALWK